MRHLLVAPLLALLACSSAGQGNTDAGQIQAMCFLPVDGAVFVNGRPSPVPGCTDSPGPVGELDLKALGWAPLGGVLVVPEGAAAGTAVPVVFVFHGAGDTGADARDVFQLEDAGAGPAIFVYPNGAQGTWDIRPLSADGRRVDALLGLLSITYCIDPHRIYIAGFSAGAVFTLYLGCNVPATFRALAAVAGTNTRFSPECCKGPVSSLFIHGTADDTIPIDDGRLARSAALVRDGCDANPLPDDANCVQYSCPAPYAVSYCEWPGGHTVPSWGGPEISRFFGL